MIINPAERLNSVVEYYFSIKLKEIAKLRSEGKRIINLGIGSPDRAPASTVIETMRNKLSEESLHGYQSYIGRAELREAFASWYSLKYNVQVNPQNEVLPLIGSKEGIMHIHMAFVNPGDVVLIPNPGYPTYAASARLAGGEIEYYNLLPENDWQPDFDELEKMPWDRIKIMWVNYPHMPTGAKAHKKTFEKIILLAKRHKVLICHDNPYSFVLNENPQSILNRNGAKEVCLELNSLSKSHNLAGWRVGCLMGKKEYLTQVLKFKSNMDSGMMAPTQFAAVEALQQGDDWYDQLNEEYSDRRKIALTLLKELNCSYEENRAGLFVWGKISNQWDSSYDYADYILSETGVFVTPGGIFGSNGDRYIRVSLCSDKNTLEEALKELVKLNQNTTVGS